MPRFRRKLSKSRIYHVMVRGNERKDLFLDNDDREKFIDILYKKKTENEYDLYAYCLMSNHVHLLIRECSNEIARIMKRINTSYACYFNKKYDRIGHVFQDRYKSEVIESERHLLAAVRYIHNNPVKAGLVRSASQYKWSSYNIYADLESHSKTVDKDMVLGIFTENKQRAKELFIEFSKQETDDTFIDYTEDKDMDFTLLNRKETEAYLDNLLVERNLKKENLRGINPSMRSEIIKELRSKSALSIREMAGVLGL
ncbi:REP-associated tyrosine transposase, partial [Lutispora sp.]|uniref:REP-associated tyrosine transposase n=1 Tax=Lutispora sp. TaxID=2828727 RepID=UPI0035615705